MVRLGKQVGSRPNKKVKKEEEVRYRITFKGFLALHEAGPTLYDALELYLRRKTPAGEIGAIILDPKTGILDFGSIYDERSGK